MPRRGLDRVLFRCDEDRVFRVSYNDDGDEAAVDAGDETNRLDFFAIGMEAGASMGERA